MPSDPRKECPSCLRAKANDVDWDIIEEGDETAENLCWIEGQDKCYQIHLNMQEVAPDMVRLLERLVAAWDDASSYDVMLDVLDGAKALLLRAKGDPQ